MWFQPPRVNKPGVSSHGGSVVGVWCEGCSVISSCTEGLRCQLNFIIFYFILLATILQQTHLWLPANPSALTLPITITRTRSAAPNPAQTDLPFQVLSPSSPHSEANPSKQDIGMVVQVHLESLGASPKCLTSGPVTSHPSLLLKCSSPEPNHLSPAPSEPLSAGPGQWSPSQRQPGGAAMPVLHRPTFCFVFC